MSFLAIIRGPLGCGKTTIAQVVASKIGALYLSIDEIIERHCLMHDKEDGYISQRSFIKANELIAPEIEKSLGKQRAVVIDGNFYWRSQIENLVAQFSCPHHIFTLKAPLNVCIERDKNRKVSHGEGAAFVVHKKTSEFELGTMIDTTLPEEHSVGQILSSLGF